MRSSQVDLEADLVETMRQIVQLSDGSVQLSMHRAGFTQLTRSHAVMLQLIDDGNVSPNQLRAALGVTQQFVSKCLKTLESSGCLELTPVQNDKRRRGLELTQQGRRALAIIRARRERVVAAAPDELAALLGAHLDKLSARVQEEYDTVPVDAR